MQKERDSHHLLSKQAVMGDLAIEVEQQNDPSLHKGGKNGQLRYSQKYRKHRAKRKINGLSIYLVLISLYLTIAWRLGSAVISCNPNRLLQAPIQS